MNEIIERWKRQDAIMLKKAYHESHLENIEKEIKESYKYRLQYAISCGDDEAAKYASDKLAQRFELVVYGARNKVEGRYLFDHRSSADNWVRLTGPAKFTISEVRWDKL